MVDYSKAARLNSHYARHARPPWGERIDQVTIEFGFRNVCPGLDAFADGVAKWQGSHGFRGEDVDGILGPKTWRALEPLTRYSIDMARPPIAWLPDQPVDREEPKSASGGVDVPLSGANPVGIGASTVVRIPVPGTDGLAIEFFPRNFEGNSTSKLFIQQKAGKKHLRLDHHYNVADQDERLPLEPEGRAHGAFRHRRIILLPVVVERRSTTEQNISATQVASWSWWAPLWTPIRS